MLPMKAVGVALIYVSWRALREYAALSLIALASVAVLGFAVTAWNTYQILSAFRRRRSTKLL
jgi:NADH:ubiquinone oxidoreductase subunit 4 (subunit M)